MSEESQFDQGEFSCSIIFLRIIYASFSSNKLLSVVDYRYKMGYSLLILSILSMAIMSFGELKMNVVHEWKYCEYEWKSQQQKQDAINSGTYDPYECVFMDTDKAKDGRIFISAPRELGPGTPASLVTVTDKTGPGGPLLRPYPDWSWYNSSCMCDGIVNVFRMYIYCNHLFVMDNGQIGYDQICNPKVLIFNLKNDELIKTIYIPLDIATNKTGSGYLITPIVYSPGKCKGFLDEMIMLIADLQGYGLIVYDSSTKRMCRVESDYMKPTGTTLSVGNESFPYMAGIVSLIVLDDALYYAPITATEIYKIKIKTLLKCPNKEEANKQSKLVKKLSSEIVPLASVGKAIFYGKIRDMSLVGTNVYKQSSKNTVVLAQDSKNLQGISGLKYSSDWDQLTYISDRYQKFFLGTVNLDEINFRYYEMELADIRKETDLFS